jgi:hypothetical protein
LEQARNGTRTLPLMVVYTLVEILQQEMVEILLKVLFLMFNFTIEHYQPQKYSRTLTHKELGTESNK